MASKTTAKEIYKCCMCGRENNSSSNFYKTHLGVYAKIGYIPICKRCIVKLFESYVLQYYDLHIAMQRVCMAFDLYYSEIIFNTCINDDSDAMMGNYLKRLNLSQHKDKTFSSTLSEGYDSYKIFVDNSIDRTTDDDKEEKIGQIKLNQREESLNKREEELCKREEELNALIEETKKKEEQEEQIEEYIRPKDIKKWGAGFESADYEILNSHYDYLTKANPNCDSNQEIFIIDLCYIKMQQMKAMREGKVDSYNKLIESYRKSFQQAGLKTVRDGNEIEDFSLGAIIGMIENYVPSDFYKERKLYKDYDGLGGYIERFFKRPLRNLQHGTTDRDYEYYVKDEEDTNGYVDE